MIYTQFGSELELLAYCGKHQQKGYPAPLMLLKVRFKEDGLEGYQFAYTMKADGGIAEIEKAVDALPEVTLKGKVLREALREAR